MSETFSAEERAAMKERARELKAQGGNAKGAARREKDTAAVLAAIAEMPDDDRVIAERIHEIVSEHAPELDPKTWYGMPGWAKDGKVVVFFQGAAKFKTRYATLGFSEDALLDDGTLWPTAYGITAITPANEKIIADLIEKAVG